MAANEIKIIVGGDVGGLVRASQQSAAAMDTMGAAAAQAAKDFTQLGPSAQRATQAVERLKNGLRDPSSGAATQGIAEGFRSALRPIEELEAELAQLHQAIKRTTDPKQLKALGDQVDRLGTQINNIKVVTFQTSLNKINQSAAAAAAGLTKIRPGAAGATESLINLSRIAQDAPFGFIGIANNINPLLESFQRLKQQAGSTQGAFKALLGSLGGAGGLGLLVGVVTAGLTLLGQGFFSGGRAAKKAGEEVDEFKKILDSAASDVARDASRVTTLFNAITSGTLNIDERKKALEELKSINKDFFGSLRDEEGLIKNLGIAYDSYLSKILDIGRAKAIESQLTKLFDQKIQLELSIDPKFLTQTNKTAQQALGNLRKELKQLGGEVSQEELKNANFFAKGNENLNKRVELQQQILNIERGFGVIQDAGVKATQEQVRNIDLRIAGLSKLQKDTTDFDIKTEQHNKKETDSLKARLTALEKIRDVTKDIATVTDLEEQIFDLKVKITLRDATKNGLSKEETDLAIAGFRKQLEDAFNKEALSLEAIPKVKFTKVELAPFTQDQLDAITTGTKEQMRAALSGLAKGTKNIPIETDRQVLIRLKGIDFVNAQDEAKKAVERLRETIVNGAIDALSAASTAFGEVLSGIFSGGIGDALAKGAQTLLSGIGGVLQEIGKQIIATSTLIKTLKTALENLIKNPIAGIAVGIGLVALGGLLKNIKIPGFAGGVNNFAGGLAVVGEQGPELVRLPRGSDVIPNHLLGGGQAIILQPSLRFAGKDMYVTLQKVSDSTGTTGGKSIF